MKKIILLFACAFPLLTFSQTGDSVVSVDSAGVVFTKVDKEAAFPGGPLGWKKYLEHNLNASLAYKAIPLKRKESSAEQTVKVQFLVGKDGKIANVKTINSAEVHPRLAREAERVVSTGPNWIPAEQNGRKVNYQATQYITFQVARD